MNKWENGRAVDSSVPGFGSGDFDLDAVTVNQPRTTFSFKGKALCDWAQDTETTSIFLDVGPLRARELDIKILAERLVISRRASGVTGDILSGALGGENDAEESEWELVDGALHITLRKQLRREWPVPLYPDPKKPAAAAAVASGDGNNNNASSSAQQHGTGGGGANGGGKKTAAAAAATSGAPPAPVAMPAPPPKPAPIPAPAASMSSGGDGNNGNNSGSGGSGGKNLGSKYAAWDRFDDIEAVRTLENEGKSADEPGMTLRASKNCAAMQCTDYVKDREEIELDEELATKRSGLQSTLNARLASAAELKVKGNAKLATGDAYGALEHYVEGAAQLAIGEASKVLLSERLSQMVDALLIDLRSNAAAACLKIGDWDGAIEGASAVLETQPKHPKALFRRAKAKAALGQVCGGVTGEDGSPQRA